MDTVISHINSPYPILISRLTISIWSVTILMYHIPYPISVSKVYIEII